MACGDPGAAFRVALLDPELTVTPAARSVTAAVRLRRAVARGRGVRHDGADAAVADLRARGVAAGARPARARAARTRTTSRRAARCCSARTWPALAIEHSMLGAAHACANPLTAQLRHHARHRGLADAAARRALERRGGRRALRRPAGRPGDAGSAAPPSGWPASSSRWRRLRLPAAAGRRRRRPRTRCPPSPRPPRRSGPAASTRAR